MTDRPPRTVAVAEAARSGVRTPGPAGAAGGVGLAAVCPRGTLPDGDVCVPVPPRQQAARAEEPPQGRARAEHDRIQRRPDRPADFSKYRLPTELAPGSPPSETLFFVLPGATARVVRLEHQEGDAEVLHAGELAGVGGRVVVTLHAVRDAGGLREYLAIFGNLGAIEPGIARGAKLPDQKKLGTVGAARGEGSPALDYEIRRLRSGVTAHSLAPSDFVADARTVGSDVRNVLPLR
jgi:hypothetical protein